MSKQIWIDHFNSVADTLLQHPAEQWQFWTLAAVGFLMFAWVFTRVGERMDVANIDGFAGFIASAVGMATLLAALTASSIYLAPILRAEAGIFFLLVIAVFASFIVAVPAIKFWTQAKYFNTVIAWFVALFASAIIIVSFSYGFGSFAVGKEKMKNKNSEHRKAINEVLK